MRPREQGIAEEVRDLEISRRVDILCEEIFKGPQPSPLPAVE